MNVTYNVDPITPSRPVGRSRLTSVLAVSSMKPGPAAATDQDWLDGLPL